MAIIIIAPKRDVSIWKTALENNDVKAYIWPDYDHKEDIIGAIVWNHPTGILNEFPKLKMICSMGAGVDHIMRDSDIPSSIKVTRIIDDGLTVPMSKYVSMAVLAYNKQFFKYQEDKKNKKWDQQLYPEVDMTIGILGLGVLGKDAALKLKMLGFEVLGFSNSKKEIPGVECYEGEHGLDIFLKKINVLVCLLPLTSHTRNALKMSFFRKMNKGSILINVARGGLLVEDDLLQAMDEGIIKNAFLDVFQEEPLPENHPFWCHPDIFITPHIASVTNPGVAVPQIVENYNLLKEGKPLKNEIDRYRGY